MNSLNFFIGFNCRNCGDEKAEQICSKCSEATYCSRECQKSDWTHHKKFCTNESKELGKARRKACFQQINLAVIFQFLIQQKFFAEQGILKVENGAYPYVNYMPFIGDFIFYEQINELSAQFGLPARLDAETHAEIKNIKSKDKRTIVVLFQDEGPRKRIFTLGSKDIKALAAQVDAMPIPLLKMIITETPELEKEIQDLQSFGKVLNIK